MRILMFTPYVPYPPNSGGQTRTFNLIKNLSRKHEITSFSFLRTDQKEPDLAELRKYCQKVEIFRRHKSFSSAGKIIKTGFSLYPYLVNMYLDRKVQEGIARELNQTHYDLIHVETYYIMPNLPATPVPVLLAEQTIEYLVYQHYAETSPWWHFYPLWSLKPLLYIDSVKHKYWEQYYWRKAKKVAAMSEADQKKMTDLVPGLNVGIVPNGVDTLFFSQRLYRPDAKARTFLFVGNFNWLQNREAVAILVKEIWPRIKKQMADARLWIVGRSPTPEIKKFASLDIRVSEDIEDIRSAYQTSQVLLAPLFGGGGTRYKILESMASRLPVVATQIGIEGIGAINKVHALISNDPDELAAMAVEVIRNRKLAGRISREAYELVARDFDWEVISSRLDNIYAETARRN